MSPKKALALAAAIEMLTPLTTLFLGANVVSTMKNIVFQSAYMDPKVKNTAIAFIAAGIIAALIWNTVNRIFGIPASSSHALAGGFIGSGIAAFGFSQLNWDSILVKIVLMIFLSPAVGFIVGFIIMRLIKYIFRYASREVNSFFKGAQVFNMIYLAFNHSFNDSQKSVGIILLLMGVEYGYSGAAPIWALACCGLALALGILFGGFKIIKTVGLGIYRVQPHHSFASQLTSGSVILLSSLIGAPVSASQIVSSSVMGVGAAEKFNAVRWTVVERILFTWFSTLPAVAVLGAIFFYIFKLFVR